MRGVGVLKIGDLMSKVKIRLYEKRFTELVDMMAHIETCDLCKLRSLCDGIKHEYLQLFGGAEFKGVTW